MASFPRQKEEQGLESSDGLGSVGLRQLDRDHRGWKAVDMGEGYPRSSPTGKAIATPCALRTKDQVWSIFKSGLRHCSVG